MGGCRPDSQTASISTQHTGIELSQTDPVDAEIALRDRTLVFRSWSGVWQGTDLDTELILNPDGTASLTYFGYGKDQVDATWLTNGDQLVITAPFDELGMPGAKDWPTLQVREMEGQLFLFPVRETQALQYEHDSAWPLGEVAMPTQN